MRTLFVAYWGEGISDSRFLKPLIERLLLQLIQEFSDSDVEVYSPIEISPKSKDGFVSQILEISQESSEYNFFFIHSDADSADINQVWENKFQPAIDRLNKEAPKTYNPYLVPVIPVTKIENWKLADFEALKETLGVEIEKNKVGLNISNDALEKRSNSKELIRSVIRYARELDPHAPEIDEIDDALAKSINFSTLKMQSKSFERFFNSTKKMLEDLRFISK